MELARTVTVRASRASLGKRCRFETSPSAPLGGAREARARASSAARGSPRLTPLFWPGSPPSCMRALLLLPRGRHPRSFGAGRRFGRISRLRRVQAWVATSVAELAVAVRYTRGCVFLGSRPGRHEDVAVATV